MVAAWKPDEKNGFGGAVVLHSLQLPSCRRDWEVAMG